MAHAMRLMKVKGNGCHLQWPVPPFPEEHRSRGGQGYVVDIDHPLEKGFDEPVFLPSGAPRLDQDGHQVVRHTLGWCEGQMHKFEDAPEAKEPSAIPLPGARHAMADYAKSLEPKIEQVPAPIVDAPKAPKGARTREPAQVIEGG